MSQQHRLMCCYHLCYFAVAGSFAIENFWHEHANRANRRRRHRRHYQAHGEATVNIIICSVAEWTASAPVRRTRAERRIKSAALSMRVNDVLARPATRPIVNAFKRRSLNDDSSSISITWCVRNRHKTGTSDFFIFSKLVASLIYNTC